MDDLCSTTPLGHVISRAVILKKLEFSILSEHDDDFVGRAANFPPFFQL